MPPTKIRTGGMLVMVKTAPEQIKLQTESAGIRSCYHEIPMNRSIFDRYGRLPQRLTTVLDIQRVRQAVEDAGHPTIVPMNANERCHLDIRRQQLEEGFKVVGFGRRQKLSNSERHDLEMELGLPQAVDASTQTDSLGETKKKAEWR